MKTISTLLALVVIACTSCTHKSHNNALSGDYIIVGYTGGLGGNIFYQNYLLINSYECVASSNAKGSKIPPDISGFAFTNVLSSAKFDSVKYLLHAIPSSLLGMNNADIGIAAPDAGYLDVRASIGGTSYKWMFEYDQSTTSTDVQQFVTNLWAALDN